MKSRTLMCITTMTLFAALALPVRLAAQGPQQQKAENRQHYRVIDIGTLGGPASYGSVNGFGNQILNNAGIVSSFADTSIPDPNAPNLCYNADCFLSHAFRWQDGVLTDLGALPGVNGSAAGAINARGWSVGQSQDGLMDPLLGIPETRAVLWKDGEILDLGTLGGYESLGIYVNNGGQVVGLATINGVPDPFSFLGAPTHTFIWKNGEKLDLGTLGGPDSFPAAGCVNERSGLVVGGSYTSSTPNPVTGVPTQDPFLWENGTMLDLGTLGGTFGFAQCANNGGQVIGQSNLAGDLIFHPFLWTKSRGMRDMGTLGGDNGSTNWINAAGEVVGNADMPGSKTHHAFVWKNGEMTDLGVVPGDPCSNGLAINASGQVVGGSGICGMSTHAFLWENDGPMVDLNTLVPPNSSLQLAYAVDVNDRGEIVGIGLPPGCSRPNANFCGHVFLLIPCEGDDDGCHGENPAGASQINPTLTDWPTGMLERPRSRWGRRYRLPGSGTGPVN